MSAAPQGRAELIFNTANREAHAYIGRISHAPSSQVAVEARQGFEIGMLHGTIRSLVAEIDALKLMVAQRDALLSDEQEPLSAQERRADALIADGATWS